MVPMPESIPPRPATASASSTTSSWLTSRSPSARTDTLHFTGLSLRLHLAEVRQKGGELFQAAQVVARQQHVDMGRRDHHAEGVGPEGLVVSPVGVEPHDPVT